MTDVQSFAEVSARVAAVAASRALYAQQLYYADGDLENVEGAGVSGGSCAVLLVTAGELTWTCSVV